MPHKLIEPAELVAAVRELLDNGNKHGRKWEPGYTIEPYELLFYLTQDYKIGCTPAELLRACVELVPEGRIEVSIDALSNCNTTFHDNAHNVAVFRLSKCRAPEKH